MLDLKVNVSHPETAKSYSSEGLSASKNPFWSMLDPKSFL